MRTIPSSRNRKCWLGPVCLTIYDFGTIEFSDTLMSNGFFTFSWQIKVTKMCPKYLLTLHLNWLSQYQILINRTGDINNVNNFEVFTLKTNTHMADTRIVCPICTVISSRARLWHGGLVVSVSDFGTRGPGRFPDGHLLQIVLFFSPYNAKLLHTGNMELYKWQKLHSLTFYIELSSKFVRVGSNFALLRDN